LIGPLTNFVLAGLFSWIAWGLPPSIITVFFFALALNNILNGFLNLSPFIELDGYYALMDALGETALRAKSFKFIRQELPKRWRRFYKFSRQEWIYTVFGLIALVYTTAILGLVGFMLVKQIQSNPALVIGAVLLFILFTGQKHLTRLLNRSKGEPTGNNFDPAKLPPQVRAKIEKGPGNQGPSGATLSRQGR
jgi:Zn-dependent protease